MEEGQTSDVAIVVQCSIYLYLVRTSLVNKLRWAPYKGQNMKSMEVKRIVRDDGGMRKWGQSRNQERGSFYDCCIAGNPVSNVSTDH